MLSKFLKRSTNAIEHASTLDQALAMTRFIGELLWKNNVGCYELIELENYLFERFHQEFSREKFRAPSESVTFLHVLTKAYDTGGHTRVVENFIRSQALQESAVLVTEKSQMQTRERLGNAKHGLRILAQFKNSHDKISAIIEQCLDAKNIVLHIHPNDIETIFAMKLVKHFFNKQILFYNHADHVFSFGYSVADRFLELSYFGWDLRASRKNEATASFVGIPLKLNSQKQPADIKEKPAPYLASAGTAYKYKPSAEYAFPAFAEKLLARVDMPLVMIGPNPKRDWWWWSSISRLKSRLQFPGKMPHATYLASITQARAYIDSFPMTGGTAFSEIFSYDVPCFGVLTGAHGYSPADQLKSPDLPTLLDDIVKFTQSDSPIQPQAEQIQAQLHEAHALEKVAQRLVDASTPSHALQSPPWHNPMTIDTQFYEKMCLARKMFSVPVHSWPNLSIAAYFCVYWFGRKPQ